MVPNINVYDAVINIRVDDPNELKVGDVITVESPNGSYEVEITEIK